MNKPMKQPMTLAHSRLQAPKITLMDAVAQSIAHPTTFEVPSPEEIAAIKVGDSVKLCFQYEGEGERMWVEVTGADCRSGVLNNHPVVVPLKAGDPVTFEARHILSIC